MAALIIKSKNISAKTVVGNKLGNPTKKKISPEKKNLIDILLLERIALAGIARITEVSQTWLQDYVNKKSAEIPRKTNVSDKPKGKCKIECDGEHLVICESTSNRIRSKHCHLRS